MKFYLSSYRLGNDPQRLIEIVGENKRVAVIPNALDFSDDLARREEGILREIDDLKKLGLEPEELDLREYFQKPDELKHKLAGLGLIWVCGGNVFVLRKAFKESGMDEWLVSQKENKEVVYGGYSAGVCVLSKTLKGLDIVDDPNVIVEGYTKEPIWDGLGLIDFAFAPHYQSLNPESEAVNKLVDYYIKTNMEYKALKDGEVIVIA